MNPPNGYEQIVATFGDITKYIRADGEISADWEDEILDVVQLPFPIALSWAPQQQVTRLRCHKLLVGTVHAVFQEVQNQDLAETVQTFGGCYMYRPQRGAGEVISTHAWGIALDLNPGTNQRGTSGNMDPRLRQIFQAAGFTWGGDFTTVKDPMHFQYATGY